MSMRPALFDAQTVIDALPVLVIGADPAGRIAFANVAAAEMLAGAAGGLIGRRLDEVFGRQSPATLLGLKSAREGIRLSQQDVALEGPMFSLGRADLVAAPVEDPAGVALTFILRSPERSDAERRQAAPVARTLAHEVRNPLAGIRAAAQLIGRSATADTRVLTDLICAETDRIRRLTDRLDELDSLPPANLRPMNVHEAIGRALALLSASFPEIAYNETFDPSLPEIRGDMDQLIQAILNVGKNAAEAVKGQKDGQIEFATRFRPGVRVRSGGARHGQMEVAVTDNGPGVAPEMQGRLFEPFATGKRDGKGLGLAIAAEIIARHQGLIEVDSRPGRTTFRILLPLTNGD